MNRALWIRWYVTLVIVALVGAVVGPIDVSASCLTVVSTFVDGGAANSVDIVGSTVIADLQMVKHRMAVVDMATPSAPNELGSYPVVLTEAVMVGDIVYLVSTNPVIPGLFLIDVSDPTEPELISNVGTGVSLPYHLDVVGSHAYVGHWHGSVVIIDISDPTSPTPVGTHPEGYDVEVIDTLMYITERGDAAGDGLRIVDISDSEAPVDIGGIDLANAESLAVDLPYVYVAVDGQADGGLHVIDVSDPTAPVKVGFSAAALEAHRIAVEGNFAFVTERTPALGPGTLHVFDISDPQNPNVIGAYVQPGDQANDVAVKLPNVFLAGGDDYLITLKTCGVFNDGFEGGTTSGWSGNSNCPPCNDAIGCREVDGRKIFAVPMGLGENGNSVCSAHGYQCTGAPVMTPPAAACLAFHPGADVSFDLNGWRQAVWCDDDEGLGCAGRTGCHHCPECITTGLTCETSSSTQLTELFVECECAQ